MGDLSLMAFVTPFDGVRNFATVYIKKIISCVSKYANKNLAEPLLVTVTRFEPTTHNGSRPYFRVNELLVTLFAVHGSSVESRRLSRTLRMPPLAVRLVGLYTKDENKFSSWVMFIS